MLQFLALAWAARCSHGLVQFLSVGVVASGYRTDLVLFLFFQDAEEVMQFGDGKGVPLMNEGKMCVIIPSFYSFIYIFLMPCQHQGYLHGKNKVNNKKVKQLTKNYTHYRLKMWGQ